MARMTGSPDGPATVLDADVGGRRVKSRGMFEEGDYVEVGSEGRTVQLNGEDTTAGAVTPAATPSRAPPREKRGISW